MDNRNLLEEALKRSFSDLESAKPGTDEYSAIEKTIKELYPLLNEADRICNDVDKIELEKQVKEAQANLDNERLEFEKQKLEEDKKMFKQNQVSQLIKQGCEVAGVTISGITMMSLVKALVDIEKTGVPTSKVWQLIFRNIKI